MKGVLTFEEIYHLVEYNKSNDQSGSEPIETTKVEADGGNELQVEDQVDGLYKEKEEFKDKEDSEKFDRQDYK